MFNVAVLLLIFGIISIVLAGIGAMIETGERSTVQPTWESQPWDRRR